MDMKDLELGVLRNGRRDETCLDRLSVYATIRPDNLKLGNKTEGNNSFIELLRSWRQSRKGDMRELVVQREEQKQLELRSHELLVKGFAIDSRIAPGFRYHVRYLVNDEYLFNGEARRLESIGLGYGRRLTFESDRLNFSDCCFWSDSIPSGYAFSVSAVKGGDTFVIVDAESQEVGSIEVQNVHFPQIEKDTVIEGNNVVKNVKVRFSCLVKLHNHNHSLINVNNQDYEVVEGIAQLVKEKGSREAVVRCIKDARFKSLGMCTLHFNT